MAVSRSMRTACSQPLVSVVTMMLSGLTSRWMKLADEDPWRSLSACRTSIASLAARTGSMPLGPLILMMSLNGVPAM